MFLTKLFEKKGNRLI